MGSPRRASGHAGDALKLPALRLENDPVAGFSLNCGRESHQFKETRRFNETTPAASAAGILASPRKHAATSDRSPRAVLKSCGPGRVRASFELEAPTTLTRAGLEAMALLQKQVHASDDLVRQLKQVVKGQHAKIQELRSPSSFSDKENAELNELLRGGMPSWKVQLHMMDAAKKEHGLDMQDKEALEAQVLRLRNQVKELREKNEQLQRTNKRSSALLSQLGATSFCSNCSSSLSLRPSPDLGTPVPHTKFGSMDMGEAISEHSHICRSHSRSLRKSSQRSSIQSLSESPPPRGRRFSGSRSPESSSSSPTGKKGGGSPFSDRSQARHATWAPKKQNSSSSTMARSSTWTGTISENAPPKAIGKGLWEAVRGTASLWNQEGAQKLVSSLLDAVIRVVDGTNCTTTLYVIDPWLQQEVQGRGNDDAIGLQCTTFYISGKVTIHAYQKDGSRASAPLFKTLEELPLRKGLSRMALPIKGKDREPPLAVLQVVTGEAEVEDSDASPDRAADQTCTRASLSDAISGGIHLLCRSAAGILGYKLRILGGRLLEQRAAECLTIAAEINAATSLTEFEQRAKLLLGRFFNVGFVRVGFVEVDKKNLVFTKTPLFAGTAAELDDFEGRHHRCHMHGTAIVGRRLLQRVPATTGIVGLAMRTKRINHIERLMMSASTNKFTDGVDMVGKAGDMNMLVGPMTALEDGDDKVVGTIQLVEKRRLQDADATLLRAASVAVQGTLQGPNQKLPSGYCEAFTEEDTRFFLELLRMLGLAANRCIQTCLTAGGGVTPTVASLLGGFTC